MHTTPLLNCDFAVSQLAFGCWGVTTDSHWGDRDEAASTEAIEAALEAGVNFFDTAEAYADGKSEALLGRVLADRRKQVVIATKVKPDSMHPDRLPEACERSLKRLGTDYIDLYQTHWTDPEVPIAETWGALLRLKEQGKVRAVGVCNLGIDQMSDVCDRERPAGHQLPYNLLWRCIEPQILPQCRELRIPIIAYSPLMHGLLSGRFASADEVPVGRARSRHFSTDREMARHGEAGFEKETFAAIRAIGEVCKELNRSMADVSLAWVAGQPGVGSVIVGATNADQLRCNVASVSNRLPSEAIEKLNTASEKLNQLLGSNPDMWQGTASSRYRCGTKSGKLAAAEELQ